ncbi:hypothetical protein ACH5RR_026232, partial [Cinchona calisaya]
THTIIEGARDKLNNTASKYTEEGTFQRSSSVSEGYSIISRQCDPTDNNEDDENVSNCAEDKIHQEKRRDF